MWTSTLASLSPYRGLTAFPSTPFPLQRGTKGVSPFSAPSLCLQWGNGKEVRLEQNLHLVHTQPDLSQTPKQIFR